MAHILNYVIGRGHSFFSVREKAWHGLGKILDNPPNSEEAIKEAQLDFEIIKCPTFAKFPPELHESIGKSKKIHNSFALARSDDGTILTTSGHLVTSAYEIVQNSQAFSFFDEIVGSKQAIFETAGALGNGERIFITAKLPDYIRLAKNPDDIIEKYLLFTSSHDGLGSVEALFTPIRVVCNNTLQAALESSKSRIRIKHTSNVHDRMKEAGNLLGLVNNLTKELEVKFNVMADTYISDNETIKYLCELFLSNDEYVVEQNKTLLLDKASTRKRNIIDEVISYTFNAPTQQTNTCRGTVYGAYNGVTGYFNNIKDYNTDGKMDREKRMAGLAYGSAYDTSQKALIKAWNLCKTQ